MPDFLHQDQNAIVPPSPAGTSGKRGRRRFEGRSPQEEAKNEQEPEGVKEPSVLFTQYYGSIFLLVTAVFLGSGYLFLYPLVRSFKVLDRDIRRQNEVLQDERAYLNSLDQSIAAAQAIPEETIDRVNEALPRTIGIPKLLQNMSLIADENGVKLNSVQFNAVPPEDAASQRGRTIRMRPLDLNITLFSPGYRQTRAFLEDLETNLRVMDVKNIAVNANEQTGELSYAILLTAYSIEPAPTSAPTTAAASAAP